LNPSILKTGRSACHYLPLTWSLHRGHRLAPRAASSRKAGSFFGGETEVTYSGNDFRLQDCEIGRAIGQPEITGSLRQTE
jgi:hypothetical protein